VNPRQQEKLAQQDKAISNQKKTITLKTSDYQAISKATVWCFKRRQMAGSKMGRSNPI
jgi:hypothetical protein